VNGPHAAAEDDGNSSVVISDLDLCGASAGPHETDAPLIVDQNAVLPPLQRIKKD